MSAPRTIEEVIADFGLVLQPLVAFLGTVRSYQSAKAEKGTPEENSPHVESPWLTFQGSAERLAFQ
jgi:hypothetical protein